ncbi:MAG: alkaline phosphatase D family protein [Deltaproteobacteria bacterium]|nr:alkaline phosphatase D family protein [Deltaproteobacteria bacterium]
MGACTPTAPTPPGAPPDLTLGTASGEVTASAAVIWGRCDRPATFHVRIVPGDRLFEAEAPAAHDGTARVLIDGLKPATPYTYNAWCSSGGLNLEGQITSRSGSFRTAPDASAAVPLRIVWGGDVGGQNVCRDAALGYPIFDTIAARRPDLFIALGDMIYGDDACTATGRYGNAQLPGPPPAEDRAGFWAHWRYNRADPHQQALLNKVPMAAVWDDHEIANDAGPQHPQFTPALQAFLDYQPLQPPADDPTRTYRSLRWGKSLEIFLLDTRQYRAANDARDDGPTPKSLLGAAQRTWLEQALLASDATWKVIVASVPLSIPTGSAAARDGFAAGGGPSGFAREAAELFAFLQAHGIRNHLWITTDLHFATGLAYRPIAADPSFVSRELVTGPLNAGVFPKDDLDPTFHPERLFLFPPVGTRLASFDDALSAFNFGLLEIAPNGRLSIAVMNAKGQVAYRTTLMPEN